MKKLTKNAMTVLENRYLHKDGDIMETPDGMFRRVANHVASAEEEVSERVFWSDRFFHMMGNLEFLPNTPCLVNAGKNREDSGLSACYVLPIEDSMDSIYTTLKDAATIIKSGGGVGYDFSKIRSKGSVVGGTGNTAGGPVSFMSLFHESNSKLKQGAVRPGAQMGILRCDHPDIMEFILCKQEDGVLASFNISVGITDAFMHAVEKDEGWKLVDPNTEKVTTIIPAKVVWQAIVAAAHKTGDPGLFFLDQANKFNPTPKLGSYEATNPCGEVVLLPGEPCNLGSIVLTNHMRELGPICSGAPLRDHIDWDKLGETVHTAVRFLDDVITVNAYPVPLVKQMASGNRKIGLGIMAWADLLVKLGMSYGGRESLDLAGEIMGFIKEKAYDYSEKLAHERGVFPNWSDSLLAQDTDIWGPARKQRNSTKLTIAPTGSICNIASCSSGLEPHFALAFERKALYGEESLYYFNDDLADVLERIFDSEEKPLVAKELQECGTLRKLSQKWQDRIRRNNPNLFEIFKTAHDIEPEDHLLMQEAFQQYVDSSISKTINLPTDATISQVAAIYLTAWTLELKGVTTYRDKSRVNQPLSIGGDKAKSEDLNDVEKQIVTADVGVDEGKIGPRPRAHALRGTTRMIPTGCGPLPVTVNFDEHGLAEVIVKGAKSGGCVAAQVEGLGRLASLALRSGVKKEKIVSQLSGISCHIPTFYPDQPQGHNRITSCADAIAVAVVEAVAEEEGANISSKPKYLGHQGSCPDCSGRVKNESGCVSCLDPGCGWSKC